MEICNTVPEEGLSKLAEEFFFFKLDMKRADEAIFKRLLKLKITR